jgi:hypothetical protein
MARLSTSLPTIIPSSEAKHKSRLSLMLASSLSARQSDNVMDEEIITKQNS